MNKDYNFCGYATKNNIKCTDGKTIMPNAFIQNNGQKVPLVWMHQHDSVDNVIGHAYLENRKDGVYAYGKFNDTESGKTAKELVVNGDVDKLSIYANKLKVEAGKVMHGCIRELSLVVAGANPGAYIDTVLAHSDGNIEEAIIFTNEFISHDSIKEDNEVKKDDNLEENKQEDTKQEENKQEEIKHEEQKTIQDIYDNMTEEQKTVVHALVGQAIEDAEKNNKSEDDSEKDDGGEENMKHNIFENEENKKEEVLMHSEIIADSIKNAKQYGSLKDSMIAHAAINNITDIAKLFPDAVDVYKEPHMIENDQSWVSKIMKKTSHTPFSRVKATFGKMNETQARAKGYIKGNKKTNIQLSILNRVTTPTTIYIKNEIDRDDVIDITDFDVIAWQKVNMRKQLDKDIALAVLFGDGRDVSDADKINEQNVRPILSDDDMFTIKYTVTDGVDYNNPTNSASDNDSVAKGIIRAAIKGRKNYKGTTKPSFITTEDTLTELLLIEDQNGRLIYESEEALARVLRCDEIITIPEMDNYDTVYALITSLKDYTIGADKGGSVAMFDDFDIDYNQMKYLMETRISGASTVPYSSIALLKKAEEPEPPVGG